MCLRMCKDASECLRACITWVCVGVCASIRTCMRVCVREHIWLWERERKSADSLGTLNIIIEGAVGVAVLVEQTEGIGVGKVLKLDQTVHSISGDYTELLDSTLSLRAIHQSEYMDTRALAQTAPASACQIGDRSGGRNLGLVLPSPWRGRTFTTIGQE